jgi:hypothetical protein
MYMWEFILYREYFMLLDQTYMIQFLLLHYHVYLEDTFLHVIVN